MSCLHNLSVTVYLCWTLLLKYSNPEISSEHSLFKIKFNYTSRNSFARSSVIIAIDSACFFALDSCCLCSWVIFLPDLKVKKNRLWKQYAVLCYTIPQPLLTHSNWDFYLKFVVQVSKHNIDCLKAQWGFLLNLISQQILGMSQKMEMRVLYTMNNNLRYMSLHHGRLLLLVY